MSIQLRIYRDAARFAADVSVDSLSEDSVIRYALDEAWVGGPLFVLRQAAWRFALLTEDIVGSTSGNIPGFTYTFTLPATWVRTHAIFNLSDSKECPVDIKQETANFYGNITPLTIRYVSSTYVDSDYWTEHFSKAVAAYLAFDIVDKISGDPARRSQMWDLFQQFLRNAMEHDALTEDPWLNHQLDGSFLSASRNMLTQGFWRFALKTATPGSSGTPEPGFSTLFAKPNDWMRTQNVYVINGLTELPVNCREGPTGWSSSAPIIKVRYISSDYLDSTTWPEEFMRVVAGYLGINFGDGAPVNDKGEPQLPWPQYLKRALDNLTVPESPWLKHQFDGSFLSASKNMITQGFWRFALVTATPGSSGNPEPGYNTLYLKPADWMRTQNVYVLQGLTELPVNCREGPYGWSSSAPIIKVRYISTLFLDPTTWPEEFLRVVASFLGIKLGDYAPTDDKGDPQLPWPQVLQRALDNLSVPESPWLKHQFDGSFLSASKSIIEQGFWYFALKTEAPAESGSPITGFTKSFIKPIGWMRTHSIFKLSGSKELPVDCREQGDYWFANEDIRVRYISTAYVDPTAWPEEFTRVVAAYLGIDWGDGNARAVTPDGQGGQKMMLWPQYLQRALDNTALLPNPWLTFQLDGSFAHAVDKMLESGLWKHAIATVSLDSASDDASPSYAYAFNKPSDWIRTVQVYEQIGTPSVFPTADCDIDFRDEGGRLHANVTPIILRYLSFTLGRAPENWSDDFTEALLAYLNYQQAVSNPKTSGAGLQAKLAAYKDAEKNARLKDEMRERPKMYTVGVLRRSRGGRSNYDREQGWRW